ncbi:calcium-binding protein CML24-like [Magnolia sinica]|uniref:calcium-binding protein CML24-like n=1 Tax=Magnolia sinica TaxID=86752 RepID=UPI0026588D24|nr:calcium-binding protein CML24-like [Magnolia sinica]
MATNPAPSVSLHTKSDIEKIFNRFDSNGDGKISTEELGSVLHALGSSTAPPDLQRMMAEMDSDGDGAIDLNEFEDFFIRSSTEDGKHRPDGGDLKDAFDVYDLDKNGLISAGELHLVLKKLGEKCTFQDCSRMIATVDSDGDGNVNFEEFKRMMTNGRSPSSR